MERKKLIFFLIFFIFSSQTVNYVSLIEFAKKRSFIIKSNFDFGYIDLIKDNKNVRIFLNMPYVIYEDKVIFMNENITFKNGEVFIPLSYAKEIENIFEKKTNLILSTNLTKASSKTQSKISQSSSKSSVTPVNVKSSFKPMNCIIIDPGHGGKDPGGLGVGGLEEKTLVLNFSKVLANKLKAKEGIKVYLTRNSDSYMSLKERIDFVKKIVDKGYNPVFISIHGNISLNPKVSGFEIYTLSEKGSDELASSVEMKENINFDIKDIKETEELFEIIKDLISDGLQMQSEKLSKNILKKVSVSPKSIKKANFYVLRYNFVPSVLIEIGYMSNLKEAKNLSDKNYLEKLGNSIAEGINDFVYYYNKTGGFLR